MSSRQQNDSLQNLVAELGTGRDKASATTYTQRNLSDDQLFAAYKSAWLPRKIIDIPAFDATRKWRNWKADQEQITRIEREEKRLGLQRKVQEAVTKARLWGGAGIYIGTNDQDPAQPIDIDKMGLGGVRYLTVLSRRDLTVDRISDDPLSPRFGLPEVYRFSVGQTTNYVHASRVVRFIGNPHADEQYVSGLNYGWGDSVLESTYDAVRDADATTANIASLVFESKIDVIKIPDFMAQMADEEFRRLVLQRMTLAMTAKGINGALLLDKDEEYDSKSASFAALPDVLMSFMQLAAGAADIPMTRLLGQAPGGLNASGDNDTRNYYDRVSAHQELTIRPALADLDRMLQRSALGQEDPEIWYEWASLWQTTDKERADIGKVTADTVKVLKDTMLIPDDVLATAAINAMIETGVLPGLDDDSIDAVEDEDEQPALTDSFIDAKPTAGMRAEARRGLEWRREYNRGGTAVGVARARDIVNGADLSDDTIKRMVSYFARHEVDKKGRGWRPGTDGYPSAGRIAWALWGGDAGRAWANAQSKRMEKN